MTRSWLKNYWLVLLASSLFGAVHATDDKHQAGALDNAMGMCSHTRFYKGLSDDDKTALDHLVHYHRNTMLSMAVRAIGVYEKMLMTAADDKDRSDITERLAYVSKFVRESIKEVLGTRVAHGGVFTPLFNCCTPRDAYFREVVTNILTVTGNATVAGSLTVGSLVVTGTVVQNNLIVTGTGTFGKIVVLSDAVINGNEFVGGNAFVTGNEVIGGTLTVTGSSTLSSLTVTGGSNLGTTTISTLNVVCNEAVGCNLSVTGTATVGALSVLSNAAVAGNAAIGGNEAVTGNLAVGGNEAIGGNAVIGGTLTVTGSSTLSSLTVAGGSNLGPTTISTLNVVCNETVGCNLAVTGTATVGALSILSNLTIAGNETIGGTLTVTGSSTLSSLTVAGGSNLGTTTISALGVVGNETVGGNLTVTGTATVGALSVLSNAIVAGNEVVGGTLTVTSSITIIAGNLGLPNTNGAGTQGIVKLGTVNFLSNFGTNNAFVAGAGNTTLTGATNVGVGPSALSSLTTGFDNVAVGTNALQNATISPLNVAVGFQSLQNVATGLGSNIGIGPQTLQNITTGGGNIAIGASAGFGNTGADSNNILIYHGGASGESATIRIGTFSIQTRCFIQGISGVTVAASVPVLVDANGQLGTVLSSRRYKENIEHMQKISSPILKLCPVTFSYKSDPAKQRQYGLIAEDVYKVFPDLVICDKEGRPETVRYHDLAVLLLNELKKQNKTMHQLIRTLRDSKVID